MDIELNSILNYILKTNNLPLKAIKHTKRDLISLFGKDTYTDISFSETDISMLIFDGFGNEIMSIYQDHTMDYILTTVLKSREIENLSYFKNSEQAQFRLSLSNKSLSIKDAEEFEYIT